MRPFSRRMFPDSVTFFAHAPGVGGTGAARRTFPYPGIPLKASVQSETATRTDGDGRTYLVTVHSVRTAFLPATVVDGQPRPIRADDKFEWAGRVLTVEAPSVPGGIGDVIWITPTKETQ